MKDVAVVADSASVRSRSSSSLLRIIAASAVGAVASSLAGCGESIVPAPAPPEVDVARPVVREITEWDEYTGRLAAIDTVEIRPRVGDYLESIHFKEGQIVSRRRHTRSGWIGRPAGPIPRGSELTTQSMPPDVPAGVPSQLLERRPDLIEAEQILVASNAREGQALADYSGADPSRPAARRGPALPRARRRLEQLRRGGAADPGADRTVNRIF